MPERENDEHWEDVIRSSSHGSDLLFNCLAAACASYRRATVCVPFPKIFQLSNNTRDYSALQQCLDTLPSLTELANTTSTAAAVSLSSQQRALLDWTLTSHPRRKASAFQPIPLHTFLNEVPSARLTGSHASNPSLLPHAVFRIAPHAQQNGGHAMEESTHRSDSPHCTITAFHGTSFENLHSILRSGLVPASNTKLERNGKIFGQGIYLSTELPVAYTFCAGAERWKGSSLAPEGTKLRCILVCSVRETAQKDETELVANKKNGEPPPAHYLVIDRPDLVKIQYILVYVDHCGKSPAAVGQSRRSGGDGGGLFFSMVVGVVLIALLFWLIIPGSSSNRRFVY